MTHLLSTYTTILIRSLAVIGIGKKLGDEKSWETLAFLSE